MNQSGARLAVTVRLPRHAPSAFMNRNNE